MDNDNNVIINESLDNIKNNKGGRPPKSIKYDKERKQVLKKIFDILGITEKNMVFFCENLENDKDKFYELEEDIKKYFICCNWNYFNGKKNTQKPHLSLIKSVLKDMGYVIIGVRLKTNKEGKTIKSGYVINLCK